MNELSIPGTLDSREVAQMEDKRHDHLIRDIETYIGHMKESAAPNFGVSDFFKESTYQDTTGRTLKCYLITKMGCEMIANKLTGAKGVQFTAAYVARFNTMEETQKVITSGGNDKLIRAQAMFMNAQTRQYKAIMQTLADKPNLAPIAREVFGLKAIEQVTGISVGNYLPECDKTFSATEVGAMFGITSTRVGKIANLHNIKRPDYGKYVLDKSPNSSKEVETFRYNQRGVDRIAQLLGMQ
jgi:Rha family phage regulatory protein